jgi:hypothetical protein
MTPLYPPPKPRCAPSTRTKQHLRIKA